MSTLSQPAAVYAQPSLMAFAPIPEMRRQVIEVRHWMSAQAFAALYALTKGAPGPNMMVVSLIGLRVGGFWGALSRVGDRCDRGTVHLHRAKSVGDPGCCESATSLLEAIIEPGEKPTVANAHR